MLLIVKAICSFSVVVGAHTLSVKFVVVKGNFSTYKHNLYNTYCTPNTSKSQDKYYLALIINKLSLFKNKA